MDRIERNNEMNRFLIRWAINAVALYVAIAIVPGIETQSANLLSLIWLALIFGVVNALLSPLLKLLTCPLIILTLGLFTLVLNTFLFWLAGRVGDMFGVGFSVAGFWPALLGSVVVSVVSIVLSLVFHDELQKR
jgi:putative membrane protein